MAGTGGYVKRNIKTYKYIILWKIVKSGDKWKILQKINILRVVLLWYMPRVVIF